MDKNQSDSFDPKNEDDREENYAGNDGTQMPEDVTDPDVIRNPETDGSNEENQEKNSQRPTPGTL